MVFDTNLIIQHIRRQQELPAKVLIPVIVVGELEAFALKSNWGFQKVAFMQSLFEHYPIVDLSQEITPIYARIDAYSQGKLKDIPSHFSARNMGKNDIWIASISLFLDLDLELHTTDNDFDHLTPLGLSLIKS